MSYTFRGLALPEDTQASIDRYVQHGIPTGGFLEAVICNDLHQAINRADETHMPIIPAIVGYLYAHCPSQCWGRPTSFREWIEAKREERSHDE
jgi:hypothetical protein